MPLMSYLTAETHTLISQIFIEKFKNCIYDFSLPQGTQREDKFTLDGLEHKSRGEGKYSVKQCTLRTTCLQQNHTFPI